MEEILKFLQEAKVFYLATVEGDQPRVRPMGFFMAYKGKLYFSTNNTKELYKQMKGNPKVEICALGPDNRWMRISGKVAFDTAMESKLKALQSSPGLQKMYKADDNIFALFYFESAKAVISDFAGGNKEIAL